MFGFGKIFATPKQLRESGVLGMNARNHEYISKENNRKLYPLVDNKVLTKKLANEFNINTPKMIATIEFQSNVKDVLELIKEKEEFVIKPAQGSGGRGIMVVVGKDENGNFISPSGKLINYKIIYKHISNILSGLYSLGGKTDIAIIEEFVNFSNVFEDYSYQGVPDVRIIVYKGFPAMTMMRLATSHSGGRANLHQGAVGVGLDIKTGKALNAVMRDKLVTHHPDTKADLRKLQVPMWKEHLEIAIKSFDMTGLGYIGADIVLDKNKGPMMLELNARPGLAIQISNGKGIRNILEEIKNTYPKNLTAEERLDFVLNK